MREEKIIDVGAGICPLGPSRKVKAAIRKAVKEIKGTPDGSMKRLERFFSSKFGIPDDRILFANSVRELVCTIVRALGPKKLLILGPAPRLYAEAASKNGAEALYFDPHEESGFAADADELSRNLEDIDLVFVANPNRITGRFIEGAALSRIMERASKRKLFLVVDESLMEFTGRGELSPVAGGTEANVITLRTTAYFYGLPGLELAYAVSDPSTVRSLTMRKDCSLNILSIEAARTALRDEAYRKLTHRFIADEKELISREIKGIDSLTCLGSDSNVYLVKSERPAERLLDGLMRAGFLIRDCGDIPGLGKSFLRLSVMGHDRNMKLLRLMKKLLPPSISSSS